MKKQMRRQYVLVYAVMMLLFMFVGYMLFYGSLTNQTNRSGLITGPVCLLIGLGFTIYLLTKDYLREIKKYVRQHADITMEMVERDFDYAERMGKRVWVGDRWTFYMNFFSLPDILEQNRIVWAYFHREHHGKTSNGFIYTYDAQKVLVKLPIAHRNAKRLLEIYQNRHGILVGYTKEYRNLFENDFKELLRLRYKD